MLIGMNTINPGLIIAWISFGLFSVFWIWMMIDAIIKQPTILSKILWFLLVFWLYLLGALIYYFAARKKPA